MPNIQRFGGGAGGSNEQLPSAYLSGAYYWSGRYSDTIDAGEPTNTVAWSIMVDKAGNSSASVQGSVDNSTWNTISSVYGTNNNNDCSNTGRSGVGTYNYRYYRVYCCGWWAGSWQTGMVAVIKKGE